MRKPKKMQKTINYLAGIILINCFAGCAAKTGTENCIDASKINNEMVCITLYEPVCGCDNKTYANSCYADRAGVTSFKPGECPE